MSDYSDKHYKIKEQSKLDKQTKEILDKNQSWNALNKADNEIKRDIIFTGKNLQGGNFKDENFANANFSGSNLKEVILTNTNLQNVDFTGADLSGADLSGAMLDGAIFTGAKLIGTNFTGAHMHGVILKNADLQDAILLDADLDNLSLEELQELVEYLALYYPHKLNLSRLNLILLDLKRIDLRKVNLKGVDFTGCNFFGVNIYELDLSECIISPAQIEQAIGYMPTSDELKKILAPKSKKNKLKKQGIDFSSFFDGRGGFDWDTTKGGTNLETVFKKGKEFINTFKKEDSDEKIMDNFGKKKQENSESNVEELRKSIEQYKREYIKQKHTRWRQINYVCAVVVSVLFVSPIIIGVRNDSVNIENIYSELYAEQNNVQTNQNTYYIDEFDAMGVI